MVKQAVPENPFNTRKIDLDEPIFWRAFIAVCRVCGNDPREKVKSLAKTTKKPVKFLTKRLEVYLRLQAERDARTHAASSLTWPTTTR